MSETERPTRTELLAENVRLAREIEWLRAALMDLYAEAVDSYGASACSINSGTLELCARTLRATGAEPDADDADSLMEDRK